MEIETPAAPSAKVMQWAAVSCNYEGFKISRTFDGKSCHFVNVVVARFTSEIADRDKPLSHEHLTCTGERSTCVSVCG
jgi:hypothetical protein